MIRSVVSWLSFLLPLTAAGNPRVEYALGVLERARGHQDEAAARFEKALAADPMALPLVEIAVNARMRDGDRSAAVKLYRELATARPENLAIQLTYADFLDQQANGDSLALKFSDDTLRVALERWPGHPEIIRRLFSHASGNKPRQEELLGLLSKDEPASAMLYSSLSRTLFEAEDAEARKRVDDHLLQAFQSNPARPDLARAASDHFNNTGRTAEAIAILEKHAEASPSSLDLRTRLGVLCFTAKRDDDGEATLRDVLLINPNQALAHQALAKFYRLRDRPELARHHAAELLRIRGGSVEEFMKLADEWLGAENPREARLLLEKAVFDHPDDRGLAEKLAIATRRDPETKDKAARLFREAEAGRPANAKPDPAFMIESAGALIDQGETKAAEERLRNAIRAFPPESKKETAAALRQLAGIWEKENRNADAARSLRQRADALDR